MSAEQKLVEVCVYFKSGAQIKFKTTDMKYNYHMQSGHLTSLEWKKLIIKNGDPHLDYINVSEVEAITTRIVTTLNTMEIEAIESIKAEQVGKFMPEVEE